MAALFLIVGQNGEPLYELDIGQRADDAAHLAHFVAHASLDLIEHATWATTAISLRCVDRFQVTKGRFLTAALLLIFVVRLHLGRTSIYLQV